MKNKIISVILILSSLFSLSVNAKENDKRLYLNEFEKLAAFNIMAALDSESMNKEVTQLQFREAITGIVGDNESLLNKVDSFGEVYEATGKVSLIKALITLVKLVGYSDDAIQIGGTNNSGYYGIAESCGILDGVYGVSENDYITYAQAGKLIYNTLNANVREIKFKGNDVYYQVNEDKILLNEYLSVYEVKGVVNSTSDYALPGFEKNMEGEITLGETDYLISTHSLNQYFGMDVSGYYKYDEDKEESKIISLKPKKDDSYIELQSNEIDKYENGVYTYTLENNKRSKDIKLSAGVQWYYNYEAVFNKTQMNNVRFIPEVGSVRFIDTDNNSAYDVVIILDYDVRVVDYVREEKIFAKNQAGRIDVDDETIIRDVNGNPIESALALVENDVIHTIFEKDGIKAKYIVVSYNSAEGIVGAINKNEKTVTLRDGNEYRVTDSKKAFFDEIKSGSNVVFYLDINKNIAGYKMTVSDEMLYGYMFDMRKIESDETCEDIIMIKIYDVSEKTIKTLCTGDKLKVNGVTYKSNRFYALAEDFRDSKGVIYDQIIRYKENQDGVLTEINTAYDGDDNFNPYGIWGLFPAKKSGLIKVAGAQLIKETGESMDSTPVNERDRARLTYWVNSYAISRRYIKNSTEEYANDWAMNIVVPNDATVLYVPKNRNSKDEYYITTKGAWNQNGEICLDAYRIEGETMLPSLIVAYAGNGVAEFGNVETTVNNVNLIDQRAVPALVLDIDLVWREEMEAAAYQVKLLSRGQEKTYYTSNEEWVTTLEYQVKSKTSGVDMGTVKGLHPGDLIRFAENGETLTAIEMYAPLSIMKSYARSDWQYLSRGIMNNGGYIGYAYEKFDNAVMGLKNPIKAINGKKVDFFGSDVFMLSGLNVFEYDAKKKTVEASSLDCLSYYNGTKDFKESSIIIVFGYGAEITDNCMYVINNAFK